MIKEICPKNICTGCAACSNICAHKAITMQADKDGYLLPAINIQSCVDCGLCVQVCPNNTLPEFNKLDLAYAACAKDAIEQLSSTSGGVASTISRAFIANGGIVYGCDGTYIDNVHHIRIDNAEDVPLLKGSKYVQSSIGYIFRNVRQDLTDGKKVLFIGTPCQCAGLKNFIGPKLSGNLYTIDFVCHGVPNQKILNSAVSYVSGNKLHVRNLQFRIKGWRDSLLSHPRYVENKNIGHDLIGKSFKTKYGLFINAGEADEYMKVFPDDLYIVGFLTGLFYRESCYQCHYARPDRVSEITLGDFHFSDNHNHVEGENRLLSKVLINNSKGQFLFEEFNNTLNFVSFDFHELNLNNSQLGRPMPKHPKREVFLELLPQKGFGCAKSILKDNVKRIRCNILLNNISHIVRSIRYVYQNKRDDK